MQSRNQLILVGVTGCLVGVLLTLGIGMLVSGESPPNRQPKVSATSLSKDSSVADLTSEPTSSPREYIDTGDFQSAWEALIQDEVPDSVQIKELLTIAEKWIETNGLIGIDRIKDGIPNPDVKELVLVSLLYKSAQNDSSTAFDYVLSLVGGNDTYIAVSFFELWARVAPQETLDAVSNIKDEELRSQILTSISEILATLDPHSALAKVETLPRELQEQARYEALVNLAHNEPREVLPLLSTIENPLTRRSVTFTVVNSWAGTEPLVALDWVLRDSWVEDPEIRESLVGTVLLRLSSSDPELAMTKALEQPMGENQLGIELGLIETYAYHGIDTALNLLPRVREGQTRLRAYQIVGNVMLESNNVKQAYELGSDLSEAQRTQYERNITARWANSDPDSVQEFINELSSDELKSHAAFTVIRSYSAQSVLTKEQMREVAKFLTTEQREELTKELEAIGM
ncbi:MAG: hypothetical protein OXH84_04580 [Gammaproteobacteria bacterium]|nr:hypothetical protein [Gammaproteobacteria bacterium]